MFHPRIGTLEASWWDCRGGSSRSGLLPLRPLPYTVGFSRQSDWEASSRLRDPVHCKDIGESRKADGCKVARQKVEAASETDSNVRSTLYKTDVEAKFNRLEYMV